MLTKVRGLLILPQKPIIFYEKGGEDADVIKSNIEFLIENCQASAQLQNKSEFWPCVHFSHSSRMLWDPKILNNKLDIIEVKLVWIWIAVKDLSNFYLLKIVISLALEGNCW